MSDLQQVPRRWRRLQTVLAYGAPRAGNIPGMKAALETLMKLRDEGLLDRVALRGLIDRHALTERWQSYERRYA